MPVTASSAVIGVPRHRKRRRGVGDQARGSPHPGRETQADISAPLMATGVPETGGAFDDAPKLNAIRIACTRRSPTSATSSHDLERAIHPA